MKSEKASVTDNITNTLVGNARHFSLLSEQDTSLCDLIKHIEEQLLEDDLNKVCVVSIIGRSVLNCFNSKANLVCNLIGQDALLEQLSPKTCLYKNNFARIDGYYDLNNRTIFLHLTSALDSMALANLYQDMSRQLIEKGFLNQWPNLLIDVFKCLILFFHISHIVVVSSQTPRFDISCINMFRIIDSQRVKLQPFVSEMLQSVNGLPPHWRKSGRLCPPQLLFVFEAYQGFEHITSENVHYYVKQLEEQISRVLRKSRLMMTNSLFSLSSSSPFVYIATRNPVVVDPSSYFFHRLTDRCNTDSLQQNIFTEKYYFLEQTDQTFLHFLLPHINATLSQTLDEIPAKHSLPVSELPQASKLLRVLLSLKELLFSQTYPNISEDKAKTLQKIFDSLFSTLDIDNRFSEGRCSKMVMSAVNFYQENLPSHYIRDTHERKLVLTLQYFTKQARGPAVYKYIQLIQNECEKYWTNGRQMCEELSLTGNNCIHKLHRLPHDDFGEIDIDESQVNKQLPVMLHSNLNKVISACNCGRRQGAREDPFSVKAANYDFYRKMTFKCHTCRHVGHIKFPVYENSFETENLSSSQNMTSKSENHESPLIRTYSEPFSQDETKKHEEEEANEQLPPPDLLSGDNMSCNEDPLDSPTDNVDGTSNYIATCEEQSEEHEKSKSDRSEPEEETPLIKTDLGSNDKSESSKNEQFFSQSSDSDQPFSSEEEFEDEPETEPEQCNWPTSPKCTVNVDPHSLPPMLHTLCPSNTPARFSSWSLVCLGSSSIYSHNLGIQDQQGFINGSHYLLPWNVTVLLQHAKNMPPLWEGKRPPGIKHKKTVKDGTQFTVKIFIGVEYECLRGHRFMVSAPDEIMQSNSHIFKETANDIATSDMPIYIHCICSRPGKTVTLAQLMRIHVVTPKAPINVTLNPFVQMTPNASPLFYPGNSEPIRLTQSSYWVLRLPMFYQVDQTPFCWPKEPPSYCRMLKGCYGIAEQMSKVKF